MTVEDFILDYYDRHGLFPMQTKIARALGISKQAVNRHVQNLVEDGVIMKISKGNYQVVWEE